MTRVDFYVLDRGGAEPHDRMICRVVEKAWQRGHAVYVQCENDEASRIFDDLLWRFSDTSFVPHVVDGTDEAECRVVIGCREAAGREPDLLVNLAGAVPANPSRFVRIVESAGFDDGSRTSARERYRYYQERGFPLNAHKVSR